MEPVTALKISGFHANGFHLIIIALLSIPGMYRMNPFPIPNNMPLLLWRQLPTAAHPISSTTRPWTQFFLTVVHFHKLSFFPILVSHFQTHSSFAHFLFNTVIFRMEHNFSVLHVTDGQKAVCFMSFWWTRCLLQTLASASFLCGTELQRYAHAYVFTPMLPHQKYTLSKEWTFLTLL